MYAIRSYYGFRLESRRASLVLRGDNIAAEFQAIVDEYVTTHYKRKAG